MLALKLAKEILRADEMVVENTSGDVQKVTDERVANGVSDADTFLASGDDIRRAQYSELLRYDGLVHAEHFL